MLRYWVVLAAIVFSHTAVAAELDVLRGSDNPAYAVPQIARAPVQPVLSPVVVVAPVVWNWKWIETV